MVTTTEGGVLLSHVHLQVLEELDVLKMEEGGKGTDRSMDARRERYSVNVHLQGVGSV